MRRSGESIESIESMVQGFIRRAIQTGAPLLATSLHRYATAEQMSWEELARSLGCTVDALDQVALCRPPRDDSFVRDVEAIAEGHVDPARLLPLLRQLQVLGTLAGAPSQGSRPQAFAAASPPLFLAARDYEEEEDAAEEVADPTETEEEPAPGTPEDAPEEGDGGPPGDRSEGKGNA